MQLSREDLMSVLAVLAASIPSTARAADAGRCELSGTYKLVVDQRTVVETGEVVKVENPQGYISYGEDKRMLVVIVRDPRAEAEKHRSDHRP